MFLAACGGTQEHDAAQNARPVAPPARSPEPPPGADVAIQKAASETLEKDSQRTSASGTTFMAPAGWTLKSDGALRLLEAPEGDLRVAVVDVKEPSADLAVASAWARLHSDFKRPIKWARDKPARDGWDQRRLYDYETSPNERLKVSASALRKGDLWTVMVVEGSESTADRRPAQLLRLTTSLHPRGYERESFKGKSAHVLDAERIESIKRFIERARDQAGVPGVAISLVQGGKVVFEGGFGVRELGKPAPVDADTLFMIASNTKALSTLLLAKLVDEGKLRWDSPATSIYPAFKLGDAETTSKVQMKHLLCACTGMPRQNFEWFFEFKDATAESKVLSLGAIQPTAKFGETFQYSNLMAAAGGYLGGHAAYPKRELGTAYDEAMRTRVFEPLGMKTATFDFATALRRNHSSAHAEDVDGKPAIATIAADRSAIPIRPSAGAWSSVRELTRYVQMELAKGKLPDGTRYVSEENLLARHAPRVAVGEDATYGMGLEVDTRYETPFVHHGGAMFGFKSNMFWLPEHGVGGVILANADSARPLRNIFIRKVLEVLFDGRPEADEDAAAAAKDRKELLAKERARLVVPPAPDAVAALARRYVSPVLGEITITKKGPSTVFDFGEWKSAVATRKNDDGTTSFFTIDPSVNYELMVAQRDGKRALVMRDMQHEYAFLEK